MVPPVAAVVVSGSGQPLNKDNSLPLLEPLTHFSDDICPLACISFSHYSSIQQASDKLRAFPVQRYTTGSRDWQDVSRSLPVETRWMAEMVNSVMKYRKVTWPHDMCDWRDSWLGFAWKDISRNQWVEDRRQKRKNIGQEPRLFRGKTAKSQ